MSSIVRAHLAEKTIEQRAVLPQRRQLIPAVHQDDPFETANCRDEILSLSINIGEHPQAGGLTGFVAQFNEVLGRIVEAAFGLEQVGAVKKRLSQLAVSDGEAFFVPDDAMLVQRQLERSDGLVPMSLASLFNREIMVQNAERPMIVQRRQQVQRLEIVGTGLLRPAGPDVKVTQIDEGMSHGLLVTFRALDGQYFPITLLGRLEITDQGATITQIAERGG